MKRFDVGGVFLSSLPVEFAFLSLLALTFASETTTVRLQTIASSSSSLERRTSYAGIATRQSSTRMALAYSTSISNAPVLVSSIRVPKMKTSSTVAYPVDDTSASVILTSSSNASFRTISPSPSLVVKKSDSFGASMKSNLRGSSIGATSLVTGITTSQMMESVGVKASVSSQLLQDVEALRSRNVGTVQVTVRATPVSSIPAGNVSIVEALETVSFSSVGGLFATSSVVQPSGVQVSYTPVPNVSTGKDSVGVSNVSGVLTNSSVRVSLVQMSATPATLSVTPMTILTVLVEQLLQAVTVHYEGVSLEQWKDSEKEFQELVFEIVNNSCNCGVKRLNQVYVVPHTPYSEGNGSSIALFLMNLQQQVVDSGDFLWILSNSTDQFERLFPDVNGSVEIRRGVVQQIWRQTFSHVLDLNNDDFLLPWVPFIAAAGLLLFILLYRVRQTHYWSRHRSKVDLSTVYYITDVSGSPLHNANWNDSNDSNGKYAVNGDRKVDMSVLSQPASEV